MMKKAQQLTVILTMVLLLLTASFIIYRFIYKPSTVAFVGTSARGRIVDYQNCVTKTEAIKKDNEIAVRIGQTDRLRAITDTDNDGASDGCDFCPRGSNKVEKDAEGKNMNDYDNDGMPNVCDKEPNNPKKADCPVDLDEDSGFCIPA